MNDFDDVGGDVDSGMDWTFSGEDSSPSDSGTDSSVDTSGDSGIPSEVPAQQVQQPQVQQPVQQQVQQPVQQPQQPVQQEIQQQQNFVDPQVQREQLAQQYETQLQQYYAFSEEDAIAFATEPAKVLPALAARLHRTIFDQMTAFVSQTLQQQLPLLINHNQNQTSVATTQSTEFFSMWPELKGREQIIVEVGKQFRALNPDADFSTFTKQVGAMVWNALGMPVDQLLTKLNGGQQQQQQNRVVDRVPANGGSTVPMGGQQAPQGMGNWIENILRED